MRHNKGFTLIEVMVVMVIIAILVTAVSLSLKGDRAGDALAEEAQRLSALLNLAREEAVMRDLDLGLVLESQAYLFAQGEEADDSGEEAFIPLADDPMFRPRSLPGGTQLRFEALRNVKPRSGAKSTTHPTSEGKEGGLERVQPAVLMLANDMFWPQGTLTLSHPSTPRVLRIVIEQDGARLLPELLSGDAVR